MPVGASDPFSNPSTLLLAPARLGQQGNGFEMDIQPGGDSESSGETEAEIAPELAQVREQAAARWRQRAEEATDPCSHEAEESEDAEEESVEENPICDRCLEQDGAVRWQEDGTAICPGCEAKEEESEEEKTPSERTVRRNELRNELAGLYADLENMLSMEQDMTTAGLINNLEARIAVLLSQLEG